MTARDTWKQIHRYQRMTQCEEDWQNELFNKALARMTPKKRTGDFASQMGQAMADRQNLLLRRMVVGIKPHSTYGDSQ